MALRHVRGPDICLPDQHRKAVAFILLLFHVSLFFFLFDLDLTGNFLSHLALNFSALSINLLLAEERSPQTQHVVGAELTFTGPRPLVRASLHFSNDLDLSLTLGPDALLSSPRQDNKQIFQILTLFLFLLFEFSLLLTNFFGNSELILLRYDGLSLLQSLVLFDELAHGLHVGVNASLHLALNQLIDLRRLLVVGGASEQAQVRDDCRRCPSDT